jgi:hypothetical protein
MLEIPKTRRNVVATFFFWHVYVKGLKPGAAALLHFVSPSLAALLWSLSVPAFSGRAVPPVIGLSPNYKLMD